MRQHRQTPKESAFSILTLDDDPIMTATIQAYFQRAGYRVEMENDPHQAIERIRNEHFDILLLDYLMTPICGDQVVEQIRQFNQELFIILLTGHKSLVPPIKTIRALDIQGYYEKSDRFDQLELLVESCAKAIRQMRTVRNYKDGLSSIMNSLPQIHQLGSVEQITDHILHTAASLLPCNNVVITVNATHYQVFQTTTSVKPRFVSRALGDGFSTPDAEQATLQLRQLAGKPSLLLEKQLLLALVDQNQSPYGILSVQLKDVPKYDQVQLMEVFSRQVSSAISNAHLHDLLQLQNAKLDQANSQLKEGYLEMITTMRQVVDAKDAYTRGHSDRVSYYAVQLARRLGRDEEYCERVRVAGLFHDVGKLSIPDDILLKNGKLTEEEYALIKKHPVDGVKLLSVLSQLRPILPAVRSHHERIDGRGYPDGLKGREIPEEARIIAVADTFDAMTSDRQYRKSLGFRRAMEELERCKGTQLDANLTTLFQTMLRDKDFWTKMQQELQDCAPVISGADH